MSIEIKVLLDTSGSMYTIKTDSVGGYNDFLNMQKKSENANSIFWSLYTFNDNVDTQFIYKPIYNVENMNEGDMRTHGGTALYDAIGTMLNDTIENHENSYIVVIITDGYENSSKKYSSRAIKEMIENKTSENRDKSHAVWDFIYLGANQDAVLESSKIGIKKQSTMEYSNDKVTEAYKDLSCAVSRRLSKEDDFITFSPKEQQNTSTLQTPSIPILQRFISQN